MLAFEKTHAFDENGRLVKISWSVAPGPALLFLAVLAVIVLLAR